MKVYTLTLMSNTALLGVFVHVKKRWDTSNKHRKYISYCNDNIDVSMLQNSDIRPQVRKSFRLSARPFNLTCSGSASRKPLESLFTTSLSDYEITATV